MYVDALVKHIVTYLWNQRFLTQKCVNTAFLSRKWVNTAFLLRKFVNTAFFVAKFCKYALIDSFQGYPAVVDSSASCAALDPEGTRYQVKVCVDHESNPGGPIGGSWDQICLPWALRGPPGPQKGPFGAQTNPFCLFSRAGWFHMGFREAPLNLASPLFRHCP